MLACDVRDSRDMLGHNNTPKQIILLITASLMVNVHETA